MDKLVLHACVDYIDEQPIHISSEAQLKDEIAKLQDWHERSQEDVVWSLTYRGRVLRRGEHRARRLDGRRMMNM